MPGVLIFIIILGVTCGYAMWRGGGPERVASAMMLAAALATAFFFSFRHESYAQVEVGVTIVDHLLLAGLIVVMIKADRLWPIGMVGMHLLNASSHWVKIEDPGIVATIYGIISQGWAYPMQILLAVATLLHQRRLKRYGVDNSWQTSWRRSRRTTGASQAH